MRAVRPVCVCFLYPHSSYVKCFDFEFESARVFKEPQIDILNQRLDIIEFKFFNTVFNVILQQKQNRMFKDQ